MATPAFAAVCWLGAFPPLAVTLLGLVTAFAGYTAVYALNDVIDYRADKEKVHQGGFGYQGGDLDAVLVRHPMAHGLLSYREGLIWAMAWSSLALIGAYILNPVCVTIFVTGCTLEALYCIMWRVSYLRSFVSGAVKTMGAVAAVFAVDPDPSGLYLTVLFVCLFFWEIGGQNIPNDWGDVEEDRRFHAKTIPVCFGSEVSIFAILASLAVAVSVSPILFMVARIDFGFVSAAAILIAGIYLLLIPAFRLYKTKDRNAAMVLFNKASYYPLLLLVLTLGMLLS
jgi:4-hydroxybenzoate polyprenyltransferase